MRKRFHITSDDIYSGIRRDTHGCAVVHALRRMFGPDYDISVVTIQGVHHAIVYHVDRFFNGHLRLVPIRKVDSIWRLSDNAGRWVKSFDAGSTVAPATFEMTQVGP